MMKGAGKNLKQGASVLATNLHISRGEKDDN